MREGESTGTEREGGEGKERLSGHREIVNYAVISAHAGGTNLSWEVLINDFVG